MRVNLLSSYWQTKSTDSRYFVKNLSINLFWNPGVLIVSIQYSFEKRNLIALLTDPYFNYRVGRGQPFYKPDFSTFLSRRL